MNVETKNARGPRDSRPGGITSPWLGLRAYEDEDADIRRFRGRDLELDILERRLRRDRLTVVFGASGVGKTSLLRAGLFPRQRQEDALPVHVRLDYEPEAPPLATQVQMAIAKAAEDAAMRAPSEDAPSLWEYLHQADGEFWTPYHHIALPLIVLDQFEEIFTLGQERRPADCSRFIGELADLAEERIPEALSRQLEEAPEYAERLNLDWHHYRIVVGIDEAFLGSLDRYAREHVPDLFDNRWRLRGLRRGRALEVIQGPEDDPWIPDPDLAERIVQAVSSPRGEDSDDVSPEAATVEPATLSVVLWQLDRERDSEGGIRRDRIEDIGRAGLLGFYENGLKSLPGRHGGSWGKWRIPRGRRVSDYLEKRLIRDRRRHARPYARARAELGGDIVDALEARGILRRDRRREPHRLELMHELLVEEVKKSALRRFRSLAKTGAIAASVFAVALVGHVLWDLRPDPDPDPLPVEPQAIPVQVAVRGGGGSFGDGLQLRRDSETPIPVPESLEVPPGPHEVELLLPPGSGCTVRPPNPAGLIVPTNQPLRFDVDCPSDTRVDIAAHMNGILNVVVGRLKIAADTSADTTVVRAALAVASDSLGHAIFTDHCPSPGNTRTLIGIYCSNRGHLTEQRGLGETMLAVRRDGGSGAVAQARVRTRWNELDRLIRSNVLTAQQLLTGDGGGP